MALQLSVLLWDTQALDQDARAIHWEELGSQNQGRGEPTTGADPVADLGKYAFVQCNVLSLWGERGRRAREIER